MSSLVFGILGAADIAKRYTADTIQRSKSCRLKSIASRDLTRAKKLAEQFGATALDNYQAIIDDPEINAVYIPLPIGLHAEWAAKAIKNKKHVWCEKSIAGNLKDVENLIRLAKENQVVLVENFMCQHHPQNILIQKLLKNNEIGQIQSAQLFFGFPPLPADNLKYNAQLDGGALNDAGAYCLYMSMFYLQKKPLQLWAEFDWQNQSVDINGSIHIKFEDNIHVQVNYGFNYDYKNESHFWGSSGALSIDRCFSIPPDRIPNIKLTRNTQASLIEAPACNHFDVQLEKFVELINSQNHESNLKQIHQQAIFMEAARTSNREKRIVHLNEFQGWSVG